MDGTEYELAWNLYKELRKEIVESQKSREQILGVKITLVSAGIGLIAKDLLHSGNGYLLVIPAFAAVSFDLLIHGISIKIKRIGQYCRETLEPKLRQSTGWSAECPLYEESARRRGRQYLSLAGNLGLTGLCAVVAWIALLCAPTQLGIGFRLALGFLLTGALAYDAWQAFKPWQYA